MNKPISPVREYASQSLGAPKSSEKPFATLPISLSSLGLLLIAMVVALRAGTGATLPVIIFGGFKHKFAVALASPSPSIHYGSVLWSADDDAAICAGGHCP